MLAPFTTTAEVRALLGLSDVELPYEVLNLEVYEHGLTLQLNKVSAGLPALFLSLVDPAAQPLTPAQTGLVKAVRYLSALTSALQVGASLGLVAPKRMTDDKSGFERFSDSPYRDVLDRLSSLHAAAVDAVRAALEALTGDAQPAPRFVTQFVAVKRGYDPVTGTGQGAL